MKTPAKDIEHTNDENVFLFSLDKQKIYPYKNDGCAISFYIDRGPTFGNGHDISIIGNTIKGQKSYTKESFEYCSFDFQGDKNALSEDGKGSSFNIKEYEVFQVRFQ